MLVDPNARQFDFYQCTEEELEHEEFSSSRYLKSDFQFSSSIGQMEEAHFCLKAVCSGWLQQQRQQLQKKKQKKQDKTEKSVKSQTLRMCLFLHNTIQQESYCL